MGGYRGSDRLVDVEASCGHMALATVHGTTGGQKSRENIARVRNHPCYECAPKQECGCLVTTIFDTPGRHYCDQKK